MQKPHLEQKQVLFLHITSLAGAVPLLALPKALGALRRVGRIRRCLPSPAADPLLQHPPVRWG